MKRPLQLLPDPVKAGHHLAIAISSLGEANACIHQDRCAWGCSYFLPSYQAYIVKYWWTQVTSNFMQCTSSALHVLVQQRPHQDPG